MEKTLNMFMQMPTKKIKFVFGIIILILFLQIGFISAQEDGTSSIIDLGKILGLGEGKIIGSDVSISDGIISFLTDNSSIILNKGEENEILLEGNKGVQLSESLDEITFFGDEGKIGINGNNFENIQPKSKENNAFIKLDKLTGEISEAEFKTNDKGGEYEINGASFISNPNSIVSYNSKEDGKLYLEESKLKELTKDISIKGLNITLPKGDVLEEGYLNFNELGNSFLKYDEQATINGVKINGLKQKTKENINVFFDEGNFSLLEKYISFGKDKFVVSGSENENSPLIEFDKNNPYIDIEEGDFFAFQTNKNGKIEISKENGIDTINYEGDFALNNGDNSVFSKNGNVYVKPNSNVFSQTKKTGSIPLEINAVDGKVSMDDSGNIFVNNIEPIEIKGSKVSTKVYNDKEEYSKALLNYNDEVKNYEKELESYEKATTKYKNKYNKLESLKNKEDKLYDKFEEAKKLYGDEGKIFSEKYDGPDKADIRTIQAYNDHREASEKLDKYFKEIEKDYSYIYIPMDELDNNGISDSQQEIGYQDYIDLLEKSGAKKLKDGSYYWGSEDYLDDYLKNPEEFSFLGFSPKRIINEYGQLPETLHKDQNWEGYVGYTFTFKEPSDLSIPKPSFNPYEGLYYHPISLAASFEDSPMGWFDKSSITDSNGLLNPKNKIPLTREEFMSLPKEVQDKYVPGAEAWREQLLKEYARIKYNK